MCVLQNSTPNYGQFGGAVFHDTCQDPRTHGLQTQFLHNNFIDNFSNGFGGAIRLGSPPGSGGGCPKAVIRSAHHVPQAFEESQSGLVVPNAQKAVSGMTQCLPC